MILENIRGFADRSAGPFFVIALILAAVSAGKMLSVPNTGAEVQATEVSACEVDINSAGAGELQKLPGIGPKLAQRIIEKRGEVGRFTFVEDLERVKGIGPKKLEKFARHVCAGR